MGFTTRYTGLYDPQWHTDGYHPKDALAFAVLSSLAYASPKKMFEVLEGPFGFSSVLPFDKRLGKDIDTQGFVAANEDRVVVAFRGSEKKAADWLANVQTVTDPGPFPRTKVHEGFQDALFPVMLQLGYVLRHLGAGGKQVWVTGHSLGGALASIFTAMLLEELHSLGTTHALGDAHRLAGLYTFGAPRVGNRGFDKQFDARAKAQGVRAYRVVNDGDAVPHVPPEPWFSHAGTRVLLKDGVVLRGDGAATERKQSAVGWKVMRNAIAEFFMETVNPFYIGKVHVLDGKLGYIRVLEDAASEGG